MFLLNVPGLFAATLVGTMGGDVSVDNTGSANYTIPLTVPPGTAGLTPELSVSYSSRNGNGILGEGFMLNGLSVITRTRATFFHDGFVDGVDYDSNDRFLLDGQRLMLVSGTYGGSNSVYRTEIDSFSRITAIGETGGSPASFRVCTKEGLVYEYGNTADSFVMQTGQTAAYSWAVSRITDANGNYMTFEYNNLPGQHLIKRIKYTGNTNGLTPYNSVNFSYEPRPDIRPAYVYNSVFQLTNRLQKISISNENAYARDYRFVYTNAIDGQSRLDSVQEFFGADSLPKTKFEYSPVSTNSGFTYHALNHLFDLENSTFLNGDFNGDGLDDIVCFQQSPAKIDIGLSKGDGTFIFSELEERFVSGKFLTGDFNGDGLTDLACFEFWVYNGIDQQRFLTGLSNGDGTFTFIPSTEEFDYPRDGTFLTGDFNGDGKDDLLCCENNPWRLIENSGRVGLSNGNGTFTFTTLPIEYQIGYSKFIVGDFNGDGRDDLVCCGLDMTVPDRCATGLSNGDGTFTFTDFPQKFEVNTSSFVVGDYDGDGKDDLACLEFTRLINNPDIFYLGMSSGTGSITFTAQPLNMNLRNYSLFFSGDFNGDGKTDLMGHEDGDSRWSLLSKGRDSFLSNKLQNHLLYTGLTNVEIPGDFNGDGLMDLIGLVKWDNQWVSYSQGDGTFLDQSLSQPWSQLYDFSKFLTGDFNGDGAQDIVAVIRSYAAWTWSMLGANKKVYLTKITEEYQNASKKGEVIEFKYRPITDTNVYVKESGSIYPIKDIIDPVYVVSSLVKSDGLGGMYTNLYTYAGARTHVNGRGFLGFHIFESYDPQTKLSVVETLAQDFPLTGKSLQKKTYYAPSGQSPQVIESTDNTWLFDTVQGGTVFPYLAKSVFRKWELGNTNAPYATVTSRNWFDGQNTSVNPPDEQPEILPGQITYGNLVQAVTDFGDGSGKTVKQAYVPADTGLWIVNLPTNTVTVHQRSGVASVANTATYTYYPVSRRIYQQITEPGHPVLEYTSTFTYDPFGNLATETVFAPFVAERTVQNNIYDPQGRYLVESRNALNHLTVMQYNRALGVVTNLTDPNELKISRQYDSLGRPVFEKRPDGTTTVTTYAWDFGKTFSVPDAQGVQITQKSIIRVSEQSSGQAAVTNWYDLKNRLIRTETLSADGTKIVCRENGYNRIGQSIAVSEPYFSGASKNYTTSKYDVLGRVQYSTAPDGTITDNIYQGLTSKIIIDSNRRTGGVGTPKHQVQTILKTAQGLPVSVTDAMSNTVTYAYDAPGNLIRTVDPSSNTVEIEYNLRGSKIRQNDPDMGEWNYTYNARGQLINQTDANQNRIEFSYDLLGRAAARTNWIMDAVNGLRLESTVHWFYDGTSEGCKLGLLNREEHRDANGELINRKRYAYDQYSRPMLELMNYDGKWYYTGLRYDAFGRVEKVDRFWRPKGKEGIGHNLEPEWNRFTTINTYNSYGAQLKVSDSFGHVWWECSASDYDQQGRLTRYQYGNNFVTTNTYNPLTGRIEDIGISSNQSPISNYQFGYDRIGNLTQRSQSRPLMAALTETSTYDNLNRLLTVSGSGGSLACSYNAIGNITSRGDTGSYLYGTRPHAVSSAGDCTYFYDANGNIVRRDRNGAYEFTAKWTSFNQPESLFAGTEGSEFRYNVDGRRTQQLIFAGTNITKKIYATPAYEMKERLLNPAETNRALWQWEMDFCRIYIDTPSGKIGIYQETPGSMPSAPCTITRSYIHKDHLGSVVAVSREQGAESIEFYSFDAWGNRRDASDWSPYAPGTVPSAPLSTDRGYTGHEQLDHLKLVHMNGRIYDPVIGRMISPDPFIQAPDNLQSFNRYAYVWNNPLSHTDPSGFATEEEKKKDVAASSTRNAVPIRSKDLGKPNTVSTTVSQNQTAGERHSYDPPREYNGGDYVDGEKLVKQRLGRMDFINTPNGVMAMDQSVPTSEFNSQLPSPGWASGALPFVGDFDTLMSDASWGWKVAAVGSIALDCTGIGLIPGTSTSTLRAATKGVGEAIEAVGDGAKMIPDNAFVRIDASRFDESIGELGIQKRFFEDKMVWMTQYKHVKGITDPATFEKMLYRQNLWNGKRGEFLDGVTIRLLNNVGDAVPAGLTNMKNGVPQWRITRDIPPSDLQIINHLRGTP